METTMEIAELSQKNTAELSRLQSEFTNEFFALPAMWIEDVIRQDPPSLIMAKNKVGQETLIACLAFSISDYLSFLNLQASMNDKQIKETARLMIMYYPNIPVAAIKTFFDDCKRGKFGKHYGRMDGTIILDWLEKFNTELIKSADDYEYGQHENIKKEFRNVGVPFNSEEDKKELECFFDKIFKRKAKEQRELEDRIKEIRTRVIRENAALYGQGLSPEEVESKIKSAISVALKADGIFSEVV